MRASKTAHDSKKDKFLPRSIRTRFIWQMWFHWETYKQQSLKMHLNSETTHIQIGGTHLYTPFFVFKQKFFWVTQKLASIANLDNFPDSRYFVFWVVDIIVRKSLEQVSLLSGNYSLTVSPNSWILPNNLLRWRLITFWLLDEEEWPSTWLEASFYFSGNLKIMVRSINLQYLLCAHTDQKAFWKSCCSLWPARRKYSIILICLFCQMHVRWSSQGKF